MRTTTAPANALPQPTEVHVTDENPRGWHIHPAYGAFYVANKHGSFIRYGSAERAGSVLASAIRASLKTTPAQIAPVGEGVAA